MKKIFFFLIICFPLFSQEYKNYKLLLVGDGVLKQKLKMECLDAGAALIAIRRDLCSVIRIDMSGKTILERTGPKLINECWF